MDVQPPQSPLQNETREAMAVSGCRRRSFDGGGEVRPGHGDRVVAVEVITEVDTKTIVIIDGTTTVHVELTVWRREAVAISSCRKDAGGCVGEVRPGHGDGVEDVKIVSGTRIERATPMHVELAPRRSEAV